MERASTEPGVARVVTWNIWWRFGDQPEARRPAIERTLAGLAPDVVCLQEVHGEEGGSDDGLDLADRLGLHHHAAPPRFRRGRSFGNAVLSRWPIVAAGHRHLVGGDGATGERHAVWACLGTPAGALTVVSTHLAYRFDESGLRCRQVTELLELIAELRGPGDPATALPVVLCGDLNATPDSDEIRLLTGRSPAPVPGLVMNDTWPQVRDDPGHTWTRDVPYQDDATWPERRLDYVMVSWPRRKPYGNPIAAGLLGDRPVDGVWPSDHLGVAVDLRLPASTDGATGG